MISGDIHRPGQAANIAMLDELVGAHVAEAFGEEPQVARATPRPWLEWLEGWSYLDGARPDADLVVGFELPVSAKGFIGVPWVDVRVHPLRFGPRLWSVRSSDPVVNEAVAEFSVPVSEPPVDDLGGDAACFTCQVAHDAALIRNGSFIRPEHVLEGIRAFGAAHAFVLVVPHPDDPDGPWPRSLQQILPNAVPSPWDCYNTLARCRNLLTVTSSTGFEAPYFGCATEWLAEPPKVSAPVDVSDPALWRRIAAALRERVPA